MWLTACEKQTVSFIGLHVGEYQLRNYNHLTPVGIGKKLCERKNLPVLPFDHLLYVLKFSTAGWLVAVIFVVG